MCAQGKDGEDKNAILNTLSICIYKHPGQITQDRWKLCSDNAEAQSDPIHVLLVLISRASLR